MVDTYKRQDANFIDTKALPNGAATIYSDGFDTGARDANRGALLAEMEYEISAPVLVVGELGNTETMKYSVQTDNDALFGSPTTIATDVLIQTGAGGVGAAAASVRYRLPTDCERYIRTRAIHSEATDASGKVLTEKLLF